MPLLLCDLDDTLVDRASAFGAWAGLFCDEHGLDESARAWLIEEDQEGHRDKTDLFESCRRRFRLGLGAPALIERYFDDYVPLFRCEQPVIDSLHAARSAGWKIAIVTNGGHQQRRKVEAAGLADLCDAVCVSAICGTSKPDPGLLHIAAERCESALDGAWMVGDNPETDIGAAAAAGIDSVWLSLGRSWPRADYHPTLVTDSFVDAIGHILEPR